MWQFVPETSSAASSASKARKLLKAWSLGAIARLARRLSSVSGTSNTLVVQVWHQVRHGSASQQLLTCDCFPGYCAGLDASIYEKLVGSYPRNSLIPELLLAVLPVLLAARLQLPVLRRKR